MYVHMYAALLCMSCDGSLLLIGPGQLLCSQYGARNAVTSEKLSSGVSILSYWLVVHYANYYV